MRRLLALLLFLAVAAGSVAAQDPAAVETRLRYLVRVADQPDPALSITDRMRDYHIPGISIAVIDNWRVVYAKGFGVTEFGGRKPVDTTTLFLAGSISKPVFTTGLLRLVEERGISLDADVNTLLKSWHLPASRFTEKERVTLRRLLTHSAGLTVWGFPGYAIDSAVPTVPQVLDGARPANTPAVRNDTFPGARWLYSGGGMTIAQLLAGDVSGQPLPTLMKRLTLIPSGMMRSTYENPLPRARWAEAASGHERMDVPVPGRFHVYPEMAAAGLWTTAPELARWAIALAHSYRGEPGGALSPAMAKQMVSKQMQQKPPYGNGWWGLGVAVDGDGDSVSFSHGGRDEGFVANVVMWPNRGRGLVIMMNGVQGGLMNEVTRAFAEEYGLGAPPRPVRRAAALPKSVLEGYRGRYLDIRGRDTVDLRVSLAADAKSLLLYNSSTQRALPLVPIGGDVFVGLEGNGEWTFERGTAPGSPVTGVANGQGANRRVITKQAGS